MNDVLTISELLKANKLLHFETATKLRDWVVKKFVSLQNTKVDVTAFNNVVLDAVIADERTYDSSKGTLLKYLQNSINFEVIKLVNSVNFLVDKEQPYYEEDYIKLPKLDYSNLSDLEVETLYMVGQGSVLSDSRVRVLKRIKAKLKEKNE